MGREEEEGEEGGEEGEEGEEGGEGQEVREGGRVDLSLGGGQGKERRPPVVVRIFTKEYLCNLPRPSDPFHLFFGQYFQLFPQLYPSSEFGLFPI